MSENPTKNTQAEDQFHAAFSRWFKDSGKKQVDAATFLEMTQGTFNNILHKKRALSLAAMSAIAHKIGADLVDMLAEGRAILAGEDPAPKPEPEPMVTGLSEDDLASYDYLQVKFRDDMRLFAGGGGAIEGTYESKNEPVVVHRSALPLRAPNAKRMVAFRIGGDSMEPVLAQNGIVIVDTTQGDLSRIHEGDIYALCWDNDGECGVKYLKWAQPGELLAIESADPKVNKTIYREVEDVRLIGRVIWAWREF